MLIVGDKEVESESVSVRTRSGGDKGSRKIGEFLEDAELRVKNRDIKID
ncbi:MAG: His/Gly/Thr/Pro-type tRNA ligase C-terminal domain-containing protein [Acidobacteria bacterium]|nr:His/Gly/Thr/Pro-type tRNA ligase C-terminal domain-containing protein [Acidobacteriota bacterium]